MFQLNPPEISAPQRFQAGWVRGCWRPRFPLQLGSATRWQSCLFVGLPDFAQFKSPEGKLFGWVRGCWRPSLSERSGSAIREDCCAHSQSFHFAPFKSPEGKLFGWVRGFEPPTSRATVWRSAPELHPPYNCKLLYLTLFQ